MELDPNRFRMECHSCTNQVDCDGQRIRNKDEFDETAAVPDDFDEKCTAGLNFGGLTNSTEG